MTNFIPNETIIVKPRNPPWITKPIKTMLNKQSRLFKNFKKHGYRADDKSRLDIFRQECKKAIDNSREMYLKQMGLNLADPNTGKKAYWKIMNKVMNKCKAPKIPPILSHNKFIINCKEKADVFANFFSLQYKPMINDSVLPNLTPLTTSKLENIIISSDEIVSLIRNLNKGKAHGPDDISAHMVILCDDTIVIPLKLTYEQILTTGIFPDNWKSANLNPIHKKGDKQFINNYRSISLLPICGKIFEKIVFNQLYCFFFRPII